MQNLTMIQLLEKKHERERALAIINDAIRDIPCYSDILAVLESSDFFTPHADQLADLLRDRDEPMTYVELDAVFKASGFEYSEKHVLACKPDSQKTVNEQAAYHRQNA